MYVDTNELCGKNTSLIIVVFLAFYAVLMLFLSIRYPEFFSIEKKSYKLRESQLKADATPEWKST